MKKKIESKLSNITHRWVDLLIPFSNNYSAKYTASELSRISKIPQQTASRYLNKFVKLNLLEYERKGKNKLFYFDLEKQTTKVILNLLENQKALNFQLGVKSVAVVVNEILKYSGGLIVFGSYASGDFDKDSDLDLAILGKYDKKKINEIKRKQTIEINEQYVSYVELVKLLKSRNSLALEIVRNHILFGNVSKIVDIFWRRAYERR